ncbi:GNAT family N-acetyltransferase [Sphingomonas jatrophae]|nr:GNAT family N-acetyltransferase [Sphingomonas jatrophae]
MDHPLDRPIWHALATHQAHLAIGGEAARRYHPDYAMFAAAADRGAAATAALAALIAPGDAVILIEREMPALPPGLAATTRAGVQMVAEPVTAPDGDDIVPLGDADAAEMLALATLTAPGPFFARTHQLGRFVGVRDAGGRLLAMAGERLHLPGWREVSGVCTHPDARGQGLAARLTLAVAARILRDRETPFLTSYADNARAIALYEALGFRRRCDLAVVRLERPA